VYRGWGGDGDSKHRDGDSFCGDKDGDEMLKAVGRGQLVLQQHSDHHHRQLSSSASEG